MIALKIERVEEFMKIMKTFTKKRYVPLIIMTLLTVVLTVPTKSIASEEPTVNLGTTSSFAVLAGTGITNTGTTIISGDAGGDVGSYPTDTFTGVADVTMSGAVHLADAVASQAKTDLVTAYNDAAGRTPVLIETELGGQTLTPGVYTSNSGTFEITGTLTLDGEGDPDPVFIFQTASTLITAPDSQVLLVNGARYCRTFWQVGSSATLGVDSKFVGHIFAMESITANTNAEVQGQLLARNGAVTLQSNIITNGVCVASEAPATLRVIKKVINDNGGTGTPDSFLLHVKNSTGSDVATSPAAGTESGTDYTLAAGSYTVSEEAAEGYTASYTIDGVAALSGDITLVSGGEYTVTITNDDISSTVYPPRINVTKTSDPLALPFGPGQVVYTYKISNPGRVALSNVSITDDKVSVIDYVSGDINADNLLQTDEIWIYTSKIKLDATTTNTVTVKGTANNITATDTDFVTVIVTMPTPDTTPIPDTTPTPDTTPAPDTTPTPDTTPAPDITPIPDTTPAPDTTTPVAVTTTVTGGQLPDTGTPWYNILLAGAVFIMVGVVGWRSKKHYD